MIDLKLKVPTVTSLQISFEAVPLTDLVSVDSILKLSWTVSEFNFVFFFLKAKLFLRVDTDLFSCLV